MRGRVVSIWVSVCIVLLSQSIRAEWFSRDGTVMGTTARVEIWTVDSAQAQSLIELAFKELRRIDQLLSPYRPASELSQVNQSAGDSAGVQISPEFFHLLQRALAFSVETTGRFDITFASVGHRYNFRDKTRPTVEEMPPLLDAIDYRHVQLLTASSQVILRHPKTRIDLGGIAKGYAVERAASLLRRQGVQHAQVTAGGDTRFIGDRRGRPWRVGIRDPRQEGATVAVLPLVDEAMSTSGDYERFFIEDGQRYHHIINPKTGLSVTGVQSVTVIGPDATVTDALSTSVFVMGIDQGLRLINNRSDYEAVVVGHTGGLFFSNGLSKQTD